MARSKKPKLIAIVGPTASGKSSLAVYLAKKLGGEIISADSRQVYRGLDIGTGKVSGKWKISISGSPTSSGSQTSQIFIYKGIPHHCIDFVSPRKIYTVAEFKTCAQNAIKKVRERGKIPILVGGTGFWIDTLVYDIDFPAVPPDWKLRRKLAQKSPAELLKILKKLDPERAKTIEQKNPRRLIRAIEIAKVLGHVPKLNYRNSYRGSTPVKQGLNPYFDTLWIGLNPQRKILEKRINLRAKKMVRGGIIAETKKLMQNGVSQKRIREFGFEYRAALEYLERKISKKELSEKIVRDSLYYARRQMTWFKRNPSIVWIKNPASAEKLIRNFLSGKKSTEQIFRSRKTARKRA